MILELKTNIRAAISWVTEEDLQKIVENKESSMRLLQRDNGGHFENLLNDVKLVSIIFKMSYRNCKCIN